MNSKKAKAYRKVVKAMIAHGVTQEDTPKYGTLAGNATTVHLDPNGAKGVYNRLKKYGAEAVLTGKA